MKVKKFTAQNIFYPITILIVLLFDILILQLPLLNTLGYEYSAVNSLLLIILSGLLSISFLKTNPIDYKNLVKKLIVLAFIPFLVAIVHSLFTMFCSFTDGLLFYLLIVFPSVFIGCSIGVIVLFYFNKFPKIFFLLIIILLALIPVLEIYFNPQVYFFSPLIGFFPGNIYDEGLSPDLKLFSHQLIILVYFLSIIPLFLKQKEFFLNNRVKITVVILLLPIAFQFLSPTFGFATTYCRLESYLSKKIISESAILHYDKISEREANFIALNQQYYFEELKKEFNLIPSKKVDVYLFNSREQKKQLFGAGNADVAKPWQYSVYISKDSWKYTLKHELIHVFSAEFGSGLFKLASNFNSAMIEGLAEAVDNNSDNLSLEELTSLAYKNNYKLDISSLYRGLNFFKQNSSLSYTYSGAFFKYLIDKYGIEKAKLFYKNGNFESVYKIDFLSAQKDFESRLQATEVIGNKAMADYYFGRLSIIQKVCPRYISDRLKKAWDYLNKFNFTESEKLFNEINQKSLNYSAMIGLSEIYFQRNKTQNAIELLNDKLEKFSGTPYYFNLLFRLGDLYVKAGHINLAKSTYEKLINFNPNFDLYILSKVRLDLIEDGEIRDYVTSSDSVKYNILLNLNKTNYNYSSIILLTNLADKISVDNKLFLKSFNKTFIINTIESSYVMFKLSQFFSEKGDYMNSRKMAALSLRFKNNNPFQLAFQDNYDKASWLFYNADKILSTFHYSSIN